MPRLLCFGDSNTYGTQPMPAFDANLPRIERRWPVVCAQTLDWDLTEEGLPGRTTARPCPIMGPHMDGRIGLFIALESHGPIDALAIMLGTNDFKAHFDASADDIASDIGFLLDVALSEDVQERHGGFEPFLIAPPAPFEAGIVADEFAGATQKARDIAALYAAEAEKRDVGFFDAGSVIRCSDVDGIHFDAAAHDVLGRAIANFIQSEMQRATP